MVTPHSRARASGGLALVATAAIGNQEVLGEQLAARQGEGDEADREGQAAEQLAGGDALDEQQREHAGSDDQAAEQAGGDQARPGAPEALLTLLHQPVKGALGVLLGDVGLGCVPCAHRLSLERSREWTLAYERTAGGAAKGSRDDLVSAGRRLSAHARHDRWLGSR